MGYAEKPRAAQITLGDGDTEELLVTPVGPNLYRLEESSLLGEVQYHDVIEAETLSDGGLRLVRVATPSGLKTASWVLPENVFESPVLKGLLDRVMAVGGNWERTFGGVLTLHLPPVEEASIVHGVKAFLSTLPGQPEVVPGGEPQ
jgi:hypothetical protein